MKIWFDITNTPQVHFLLSILNGLEKRGIQDFIISARDFSETIRLLEKRTDLPVIKIGSHAGKDLAKKAAGLFDRFMKIYKTIPQFDISLSCGSEAAIWTSVMKRKRSIAFGDNDLARQWTYSLFIDYAFFPRSVPVRILKKQGLWGSKLYQYDGFKEHIYLADYKPDQQFLRSLPFSDYVVVRPENIRANYLNSTKIDSITPALLDLLSASGANILFLPRYETDRQYTSGIKNIFIPETPVNGLDACYFSNAVFTGAGTFAREAACLGVPSFSFFLGERLLAVDNDLVNQGKMFFSRIPEELVNKFIHSDKRPADLEKAKAVNNEVLTKLNEIIIKLS